MGNLKISIIGPINGEMFKSILDQVVNNCTCEKIVLIISSTGGNVVDALAICDLIKSFKKPITAIALGQCNSSANLLFLLGDKRYAGKNTSFLFHSCMVNLNGTLNQLEIEAKLKKIKELNQIFINALKEKTSYSLEVINGIFDSNVDYIIDTNVALKKGLVTAKFDDINDLLY